jgi:hypothetical protein
LKSHEYFLDVPFGYAIGVAVIEMAPGDTTVGSTPIELGWDLSQQALGILILDLRFSRYRLEWPATGAAVVGLRLFRL